ncbi:uncharacterized protein N7443_005615 [Penicillium atrosanguineum]|uniref:Uncharacterized protein n=1 Tax=Penicillium atrosanguineum TaxID=1132637 RepID=A0A9W9PTW9_9EURO|nr:uncharacterized protein N7443_005615 [Penicillium atrosanguineum]KAJ5300613.1 hypothetical protein N7443_005615 [Penicillium atrosanguineum]KAJ5311255.1 hypothetical protein N7476_007115 [Penicillium atrosanguineum]
MTQNMQEKPMPLGIQRSRSRLGELLAADTLVAAGSATLITPAVMIFDRLVVEKSFYNQPLLPAFRKHLWISLTQPSTFLTSRPALLVWSLYTATFATANASETLLEKVYPKVDHAIASMTTFASTFVVNSSVGIWKDADKPPPKTVRTIGRTKIPLATYSAFLLRDGLTIFGSFTLPSIVSTAIPDSVASQDYLKILIAQLAIPASIQLISTPIHLFGLDLYNRPQVMPTKERLARISRDWVGASLLRMCRIIPAFGIGGFVNTEGRLYLHEQLDERRNPS